MVVLATARDKYNQWNPEMEVAHDTLNKLAGRVVALLSFI